MIKTKQTGIRLEGREERAYPIFIERGIARGAIEQADYIVTDSRVANIYRRLLKDKPYVIKIAPGEASKSFREYKKLVEKLKDCEEVTIFGGGVVGDLGGFAASTLRRGILIEQVPTTLVAMVDSSIGGKNGINLGKRKNYLGTIEQPNCVYIDPDLLKTLPKKEISNGVAEIIKYGAIEDPELLERMQSKLAINDEDLEEIILRCVNIKGYFVEQDERDRNKRHALNFGHTIGHALELLYNLPHGQAISIGMVYEARLLSSDYKKLQSIRTALEANNLPTELPKGANIEDIIKLMKADKKGRFIFALDEVYHHIEQTEEDIRNVLKLVIKKEEFEEEDLPF